MNAVLEGRISKGWKLLRRDPVLLGRIAYTQLLKRFGKIPAQKTVKEIAPGVFFEFDFSYGPQIKTFYYDAYEPLTIAWMKQFLKRGDTFIDVGANIGILSAVALGLVGKEGQVHSFEPSPRDYQKLKRMAELNPGHRIYCLPYAAGEIRDTRSIDISGLDWVGWNTLVPGFMRKSDWRESTPVQVIRLDQYLAKNQATLGRIALIKIDTEGFEYFVLKGLGGFFQSRTERPPILCEVTPRANQLMGISLEDLSVYMNRYGYQARSFVDGETPVNLADFTVQTDVIFR